MRSSRTSEASVAADAGTPTARFQSQRIAVYALAGTVGFARVHVGAHFPLDVVAGAALGYGLGWLWNLAVGVPASAATDASLVRDERTP